MWTALCYIRRYIQRHDSMNIMSCITETCKKIYERIENERGQRPNIFIKSCAPQNDNIKTTAEPRNDRSAHIIYTKKMKDYIQWADFFVPIHNLCIVEIGILLLLDIWCQFHRCVETTTKFTWTNEFFQTSSLSCALLAIRKRYTLLTIAYTKCFTYSHTICIVSCKYLSKYMFNLPILFFIVFFYFILSFFNLVEFFPFAA